MSRLTFILTTVLLSTGWTIPASAQFLIPRRGPMSIPRAPSSFSNGYTYIAPSYYPTPVWTYDGFFLGFDGVSYPGYYLPRPLRMSEMPGSPLNPPPDALPAQINPWDDVAWNPPDPALREVVASSPAARARALDLQATGDQYLRQQKYQSASSTYRQAVSFADDLAALHLRYGIVFAILGRYDRASQEFRRATYIDPSLPTSEFTLESLFGPNSQLVRASVISKITRWVGEDVADPDRQYILGVLLHFDQDERAQELFSAAFRLTNGAEHLAVFLQQPAADPRLQGDRANRDARTLPAAPPPQDAGVEPPPAPGILENTPPAKPKSPPKGVTPLKTPHPGKLPEASSNDGPILLPPSPK